MTKEPEIVEEVFTGTWDDLMAALGALPPMRPETARRFTWLACEGMTPEEVAALNHAPQYPTDTESQ